MKSNDLAVLVIYIMLKNQAMWLAGRTLGPQLKKHIFSRHAVLRIRIRIVRSKNTTRIFIFKRKKYTHINGLDFFQNSKNLILHPADPLWLQKNKKTPRKQTNNNNNNNKKNGLHHLSPFRKTTEPSLDHAWVWPCLFQFYCFYYLLLECLPLCKN